MTNQSLDLRFLAYEERMDRTLDALEHRTELRFAAVDARFDQVDARFDLIEHELLGQVDRRLRSQAWMTISTIVAVGGVIVAAIRI